eukprot:2661024-Pleurochrysis_carterae.AAC.10
MHANRFQIRVRRMLAAGQGAQVLPRRRGPGCVAPPSASKHAHADIVVKVLCSLYMQKRASTLLASRAIWPIHLANERLVRAAPRPQARQYWLRERRPPRALRLRPRQSGGFALSKASACHVACMANLEEATRQLLVSLSGAISWHASCCLRDNEDDSRLRPAQRSESNECLVDSALSAACCSPLPHRPANAFLFLRHRSHRTPRTSPR